MYISSVGELDSYSTNAGLPRLQTLRYWEERWTTSEGCRRSRKMDLLFQNISVLRTNIQNTRKRIRWSHNPVSFGRIEEKDWDPRVSSEVRAPVARLVHNSVKVAYARLAAASCIGPRCPKSALYPTIPTENIVASWIDCSNKKVIVEGIA